MEIQPLKEILLEEMKRRGINQQDLANILGVSPGFVSQILSGKKKGERNYYKFLKKLAIELPEPTPAPEAQKPPEQIHAPPSKTSTLESLITHLIFDGSSKIEELREMLKDQNKKSEEAVDQMEATLLDHINRPDDGSVSQGTTGSKTHGGREGMMRRKKAS